MVTCKKYNLNANEDFVIFLTSKLITFFIGGFHFDNETPTNCLLTTWKCTYILDFGPWGWSALNMGFVGEWPSRMQEQWIFRNRTGGQQFSVGSIFSREGCTRPVLTPPKVRRGVLSVRQYLFWFYFY